MSNVHAMQATAQQGVQPGREKISSMTGTAKSISADFDSLMESSDGRAGCFSHLARHDAHAIPYRRRRIHDHLLPRREAAADPGCAAVARAQNHGHRTGTPVIGEEHSMARCGGRAAARAAPRFSRQRKHSTYRHLDRLVFGQRDEAPTDAVSVACHWA